MYSSDISIFRHRYLLLFVPLFAIEIADYSNVEYRSNDYPNTEYIEYTVYVNL